MDVTRTANVGTVGPSVPPHGAYHHFSTQFPEPVHATALYRIVYLYAGGHGRDAYRQRRPGAPGMLATGLRGDDDHRYVDPCLGALSPSSPLQRMWWIDPLPN
jgi:hypothetical protein